MNKKPPSPVDNKYSFDTNLKVLWGGKLINNDRGVFLKDMDPDDRRLSGVNASDQSQFEGAIDSYAKSIIGAIHWYRQKAAKRDSQKNAYMWCSIAGLIILPIGIYCLSRNLGVQSTEHSTAMITIAVSGFIGVYRGITLWVERVFEASNFRITASDLMEKHFEFVRMWKTKAILKADENGEPAPKNKDSEPRKEYFLNPVFLAAVDQVVAEARSIKQKQRVEYMSKKTPTSIDVVSILNKAATDGKNLVTGYQSPTFAAAVGRQAEISQLKEKLITLKAKRASLEKEQEELGKKKEKGADGNGPTLAAITERLARIPKEQLDKDREIIEVEQLLAYKKGAV